MRLYSLYLLIPAIQAYRPILHDKVVSTVYNNIDEGDDMNAVPTIEVNIEENENTLLTKRTNKYNGLKLSNVFIISPSFATSSNIFFLIE